MGYLFTKYFNALNRTDITYAITGCTENYPEDIHSDIDIVIHNDQFKQFWSFMKTIEDQEMNWVQIISHEITAHYCIVTFSDGKTHQLIKPDVCSDYYRKGVFFLRAEYLLKNRIYNPKGFYQLSPDKEFIYYFLKKIDKGRISQEQFDHLSQPWNLDRLGCEEAIKPFFTEVNQNIIKQSFDNNDYTLLKQNINLLKQGLHQNLKFSIKDYILKINNRINRILHPTGLVVAFMGPDGSGKTTIINGVRANLTEAFRQSKQYHLFPKGGADGAPVKNPHELKPRGHIGSILKLFYFLGLYVFGYWAKIYPLKVRSTFIIFDRYYHDLLVDPYRYRHGAGIKWLKVVGYFIPKPDLWILLDAPAEVIQQRKSEVTAEETTRQVLAYKALFSILKNGCIINANQQPEQVIYEAKQLIIDFMKQRIDNRYKKI